MIFDNIQDALELIRRGGFMMYPLLVCSILSVAVMIERYIALNRASIDTSELMSAVRDRLEHGDVQGAQIACETARGPVARVLAGGLSSAHLSASAIERHLEELALSETPELNKRLVWLDTIITIAPLLGLLGTVIGMISAFRIIGTTGTSHPTAITAGVAEALIVTATGLAIAIVTLVGYNALTDRVRALVSSMELRATQLLNMLADLREAGPIGREEKQRL